MSVKLIDTDIRRECLTPHHPTGDDWRPLLSPVSEEVSGNDIVSYGITSSGYDARLCGKAIKFFKNTFGGVVSPKRFKEAGYERKVYDVLTDLPDGAAVVIPAHGYVLAQTHEYISIRENMDGDCVGKSTYARCGIVVNTTPMEPGWEGRLTLEIFNGNPASVEIYVMEGIAQLRFWWLHARPGRTYRDKKGKYQGQTEVTSARVL